MSIYRIIDRMIDIFILSLILNLISDLDTKIWQIFTSQHKTYTGLRCISFTLRQKIVVLTKPAIQELSSNLNLKIINFIRIY
ncbi:hypothetical protein BpHYR1_018636 [Brachionus plicatilis]|uniref:Uncharacterized protein n=1 Tax=Brachionus plicatilis TaxID=10195 RepID=A0A3M7P4D0_BRAPC|nr:hypothetical protein BpHYR1_018636 [Brachionus plicatilis]